MHSDLTVHRNLLVHPNGRNGREDALGLFLNCVQGPGENVYGWQRRNVSFSLQVVNRLDASKSAQKGAPQSDVRGSSASRLREGKAGSKPNASLSLQVVNDFKAFWVADGADLGWLPGAGRRWRRHSFLWVAPTRPCSALSRRAELGRR